MQWEKQTQRKNSIFYSCATCLKKKTNSEEGRTGEYQTLITILNKTTQAHIKTPDMSVCCCQNLSFSKTEIQIFQSHVKPIHPVSR